MIETRTTVSERSDLRKGVNIWRRNKGMREGPVASHVSSGVICCMRASNLTSLHAPSV